MKIHNKNSIPLKVRITALALSLKDPRTPIAAKALIWFVIAYAFSPIDLIPDFIPLIGHLDDLLIIPLGVALAIKLIPKEVYHEQIVRAKNYHLEKKNALAGIVIVALLWVISLLAILYGLYRIGFSKT